MMVRRAKRVVNDGDIVSPPPQSRKRNKSRVKERRRRLRQELLEARNLLAGDICLPIELVDNAAMASGEETTPTEESTALRSVLPWIDRVEPVSSANGSTEQTYLVRGDMIAVDGGDAFPQWDELGLRMTQQYGGSISVYRLPAETPIGPSFTPLLVDLIGDTDYSVLPVFSYTETEKSGSKTETKSVEPDGLSVATDEIHVRVTDVDSKSIETYLAELDGVDSVRPLPGTNDQFVLTLSKLNPFQTIEVADRLNQDDAIVWSIPNWYHRIEKFAIPNDPLFGNQWPSHNTGQLGGLAGHDINMPEAWDINAGGSADIIVGVIDDGVSTNHEDITVWVNPGEVTGDGIDNDGNGWIDDVNGWNFVSGNNNSSFTADGDNHGTAVAGLAAADGNNGIGVAGGAYNSPVISARIFEGNSVASTANIAAAIYYMGGRTADGNGSWSSADVVNNSWGGGPDSVAISDALIYGTTSEGGIPYLFSTGNGGRGFLAAYPARYSTIIPGVIGVGGTGIEGDIADYSQGGPPVDIVSPTLGSFFTPTVAIETTDLMGTIGYADGNYTGTGATGFGGTSASAPIATGVAALALAELELQNIDLTAAEFRDLMRANTRLIADLEHDANGHNLDSGYGMIDAFSLLSNIGDLEISVLSTTEDLVDGAGLLDFGTTDVGVPVSSSLLIRNQGTSDLTISSLTLPSGAFAIETDDTPVTLGAGGSVSIPLVFTPTVMGESTQTLTINSDDADEGTFEVDLRGIGTRVVIEGIVFEDREGDGVQGPANEAVPGSRVFIDLNDNGILDLGTEFETTTPVDIVDLATVLSPIEVSNISEFDRLEVNLDITHTWNEDLTIELVAPSGEAITLVSAVGGSSDNFTDTTFDDSATTPIAAGTAPFTGVFRPAEPLSDLLGVDANGTWNLRVFDSFNGDDGTINRWKLTIGAAEPNAVVDASGMFQFRNIADGTYEVGFGNDDTWSAVAPSDSVSIEISNSELQTVSFGVARNDVAYIQAFRDNDGDGQIGPDDALLDDPVLFIDSNGNGQFDSGSTYLATPDLTISDNTTVNSTQTVSGFSGTPGDI
ncbi:MAG: S8 family serine peptidase, partial [Planctomycetota bacterium]